MNRKKLQQWILKPNLPLLVSGKHGVGKTYNINKWLEELNQPYTKVYKPVSNISNISCMFQSKPEVYVVDDCDAMEQKEFQDIVKSVSAVTNLFICICEERSAVFLSSLFNFDHVIQKQISYTKYKQLLKDKMYTRQYYETYFDGDIRQALLQKRITPATIDREYTKYELFDEIKKGNTPEIKDVNGMFHIICESYLQNKTSMTFPKRLLESFDISTYPEFNKYVQVYGLLKNENFTNLTFTNKQWTRISNIKYRKKMFQHIRRSISESFIGYESYYKIIDLRNELLSCIKEKKIKELICKLNNYDLNVKVLNYLPKLQCDDEFSSYITRLKPVYSYLRSK